MRTPSAAVTAAVLAAALSTGCSGGDEKPQTLPTLSPSTTTTPTGAPVEVPAAARERTPQGADAFVRFFFAEMNAAFQTSDGDRIRRLTNGQCETCENYASSLDKGRDSGEFMRGTSFLLRAVAAPPLEPLGVIVDVAGDLPARDLVDGGGKLIRKLPADGTFRWQVAVKWASSEWRVSGIRANA